MVDSIYVLSYIASMILTARDLFTALSNDVRLRCLVLLQLQGELCVCELIQALDFSQPMISRHLALLRDSGLVKDRRAGQWVYYSINPELEAWVAEVLLLTAQSNSLEKPFSDDIQMLTDMPNRPSCA
ncbi:Arsenical resistance operon repressor [hydrothermal vent metagenome]|uniref:Arsenical resistance operon repressor n=1 Tax=hydrothermal vent metagenome TaxID=652676 RepID=A0A3B0ZXQ6_9ZZZZ